MKLVSALQFTAECRIVPNLHVLYRFLNLDDVRRKAFETNGTAFFAGIGFRGRRRPLPFGKAKAFVALSPVLLLATLAAVHGEFAPRTVHQRTVGLDHPAVGALGGIRSLFRAAVLHDADEFGHQVLVDEVFPFAVSVVGVNVRQQIFVFRFEVDRFLHF